MKKRWFERRKREALRLTSHPIRIVFGTFLVSACLNRRSHHAISKVNSETVQLRGCGAAMLSGCGNGGTQRHEGGGSNSPCCFKPLFPFICPCCEAFAYPRLSHTASQLTQPPPFIHHRPTTSQAAAQKETTAAASSSLLPPRATPWPAYLANRRRHSNSHHRPRTPWSCSSLSPALPKRRSGKSWPS
jgi:hypothetical protein